MEIMKKSLPIKEMIAIITIVLCTFSFSRTSIFAYIDSIFLKHIFIVLFGIIGAYDLICRQKKFIYGSEIKTISLCAMVLVLISFAYMLYNGYSNAWISEVYFLLVSPWFVFCYLGDVNSKEKFDIAINAMFYSLCFIYLLNIIPLLNASNISRISFVESESPFESESAHIFSMLYMYYTYRNFKWKKIISLVFAVLAWKRMTLIFVILFTILQFVVRSNKPMKISYRVIVTIVFCLVPMIMELMLTNEFSQWFYTKFGIDFRAFLMSRYDLISYTMNANNPSHGLGTFFIVRIPWYTGYIEQSMHNDIVRLYLEVSIIGLGIFIWSYASLAKTYFSGYVMLYVFVELACSHFLGDGSIPFWIIILLCVYYMNTYDRENNRSFEKKGKWSPGDEV